LSVTLARYYNSVSLARGQLSRGLESIATELALGRSLRVNISREDLAVDELTESTRGDYAALETLTALGQPPHKELWCSWTDGLTDNFLTITIASSPPSQIHAIITARDGALLKAFLERLEKRLGLAQATNTPHLAGPRVITAAKSSDLLPPNWQSPLSEAQRVSRPPSELAKVHWEGVWKVIVALVTLAGAVILWKLNS
jgi:hypothetical protein